MILAVGWDITDALVVPALFSDKYH